jgi:hypothetical protein
MNRLDQHPPKRLALLPCQSAVRDESTKQWSIHGTFDQMEIGDKFPVMVPGINVFVALGRGGADKDTVHLAVLTPSGDVLGFCIIPVMWGSNTAAEFYATPRNVIFRTPGKYKLRLFVEGHVLAEREISVVQAKLET